MITQKWLEKHGFEYDDEQRIFGPEVWQFEDSDFCLDLYWNDSGYTGIAYEWDDGGEKLNQTNVYSNEDVAVAFTQWLINKTSK